MKKFRDPTANRTRDLPACRKVPEPTASPHIPEYKALLPGLIPYLRLTSSVLICVSHHNFAGCCFPSLDIYLAKLKQCAIFSPCLSEFRTKFDGAESLLGRQWSPICIFVESGMWLLCSRNGNSKGKIRPKEAMKAQRGSRVKLCFFFDHASATVPVGKRDSTTGWASRRDGLDGRGKSRPHRDSIPGPCSP